MIKEAVISKPPVLFACSNGNTFNEVFYPVIKEMENLCHAHVLVSDFCLNETAKKRLHALKESRIIEEFCIVRPNREKESLRHYHKRLHDIVCSIQKLPVDMVVLNGDFQIDNRYILSPFLGPRIKRVVLQGGKAVRVLKAYREAKGLEKKKNSVDFSWTLKTFKSAIRRMLSLFYQWQNHYFFPYWCQKKVFPLTGYEYLAFAAGICEHVICYDPLLKEALQTTNPLLKHVYVGRHPLDVESNDKDRYQKETGRLLVLFSGNISNEMSQEKINKWVQVTNEIVQLKNVCEIHLRIHPRCQSSLSWPRKILKELEKLVYFVKMIDSKKISLEESLNFYDGIVGSPSAALRVARAMNKSMFILGLPNCCDGDENDQSWLLGSGEGIQWIDEGKAIRMDQLKPPMVAEDRRSRVSDILLDLLELSSHAKSNAA